MKLKMGAPAAVAVAAFLAFGATLVWNVDNSYGTTCGAWIAPDLSEAKYQDSVTSTDRAGAAVYYSVMGDNSGLVGGTRVTWEADACGDARSERTPAVAGTGLLAGAVIVGVIAASRRETAPANTTPEPDAAA